MVDPGHVKKMPWNCCVAASGARMSTGARRAAMGQRVFPGQDEAKGEGFDVFSMVEVLICFDSCFRILPMSVWWRSC